MCPLSSKVTKAQMLKCIPLPLSCSDHETVLLCRQAEGQGLRGSSDREGQRRLHFSLAWQMLVPNHGLTSDCTSLNHHSCFCLGAFLYTPPSSSMPVPPICQSSSGISLNVAWEPLLCAPVASWTDLYQHSIIIQRFLSLCGLHVTYRASSII